MRMMKCRNSVFCVQFLVFFILGTICGAWLYRCLIETTSERVVLSNFVFSEAFGWGAVLSVFRPLIIAWLACIHPFGYYILFLLIFLRGTLMSYAFCTFLYAEISPVFLIVRGFLFMPLFYLLCRFVFDSKDHSTAFLL